MTTSETTQFIARLPLGYTVRPRPNITKAARQRWSRPWEQMLGDLYRGGGYGWQTWGSGHMSSGIVRAVEARGMIQVAENPKSGKPNLFRLTGNGYQIGQGVAEEMHERSPDYYSATAPEDAPLSPQPRELDADDQYLYDMYVDELQAVRGSLAFFAEMKKGPDAAFVDHEAVDRLTRREGFLTETLRGLR